MLNIYQLSDGYCYNTDSIVLAHFAKNFLRKNVSILDIGSGSGVIGLLCAREVEGVHLEMVEIDRYPFLLGVLNAKNASFLKDVCAHNCNIFDFKKERLFDVVIVNPPFYHEHVIKSPNFHKSLARIQDSMPLRELFALIKRVILPRGSLVMCYDAKQVHTLLYEMGRAGFTLQDCQFVHAMNDREASIILLRAKIDYKGMANIHPPLFTHNSPNQKDNTYKLLDIYKWACTNSIKVESNDIDIKELEKILANYIHN